jgi:Type II CAAX prenyl endopeptidase Rce1-like
MPSPRLGPADVAKRQAGARSTGDRESGRVSDDPLQRRPEATPPTSSTAGHRTLAILEPLILFGLVMLYIWELRAAHPRLWTAILGLMLLSHFFHRDGYSSVGLARCRLQDLKELGPALASVGLLMAASGLLMGTVRPIRFGEAVLALAAYLPWGLLQQCILNGYFLNRFDALLSARAASLAAAALFCIAHTPNWFLMPVTFVGGYYSTRVYRQHRCLYVLGMAHALIGFLIFLVVPDSITHHLRVGPGWSRW